MEEDEVFYEEETADEEPIPRQRIEPKITQYSQQENSEQSFSTLNQKNERISRQAMHASIPKHAPKSAAKIPKIDRNSVARAIESNDTLALSKFATDLLNSITFQFASIKKQIDQNEERIVKIEKIYEHQCQVRYHNSH